MKSGPYYGYKTTAQPSGIIRVRHEESRRKLMLGSSPSAAPIDGSALVSHKPSSQQSVCHEETPTRHPPQLGPPGGQPMRHGRLWCDVCKKPTHTIDTCWKIHGKPADWKPSREQCAHAASSASTSPTPQPFTKEQMEALQRLFGQPSAPNTSLVGSGNVALQGEFPLTLMSRHDLDNAWIIDSGASDHMTGNFSLFNSYSPCRDSHSIRIVNGSCSKVFGIGSIILSPHICLKSVLFVPDLNCNLLHVSQLNNDLQCCTNFSANSCAFQDLTSDWQC